MATKRKSAKAVRIPLMALRGLMIFPHMVLHFDVGRPRSIAALEAAMLENQRIFLVAQHDAEVEEPGVEDICRVGTIATIKQVLNLPGDSLRVLVEGQQRAVFKSAVQEDPYWIADVLPIRDEAAEDDPTVQALMRTTHDFFDEYAKASMRVSPETLRSVKEVDAPDQLADVIAANVLTRLEDRQAILEEVSVAARLETLCGILVRETELAGIEKQVQGRIRKQLEKNQKDYYLREQIRAIQEELGDDNSSQNDELRERMRKTPLSDEAREKVERELDRLSRMAPGTPEISVSQTYIEWILDLPWGAYTTDNLDLKRARRILDEEHYGMQQVKDRVIEYLAVRRMKQMNTQEGSLKGPILCFVGPPGVGKTSIVKCIAKAVGRKFVQMSLGGVRDEAEIRGHRRTYIGAIPGRIIAGMKQSGTMNPVFLFDEIDKMSNDFRGDPASAMLEVLDGEQNGAFRDHYLELPFDLSQVMFITTANSVETIPGPLLDRMEIIEVPSYTEEEKLQIAKKHLLHRQVTEHGLTKGSVRIGDAAMKMIIEGYTREAGVRTLTRTIARVVRKAAVDMLENDLEQVTVSREKVQKYLGAQRYLRDLPEKKPCVGVVNGLAYTTVGGETLQVECTVMTGSGNLSLTGQLGDVMKESARAALSWVRAHAAEYELQPDFHKNIDIHIHVPEGAVPKDGPSAGVTMATALVSALTERPVRQDVAMTGEITLRGRVLPIGGVKEKMLAAYRAGIKTLLLPMENKKDLEEIPERVRNTFSVHFMENIEDVLKIALLSK
ncbi:MAG: endopeptidase La [Clostridia bacterium]|nr:endopeptidase La [Clostridia bacterium]MBR6787459.1 endopeptidase La [Clostridia bacterium]